MEAPQYNGHSLRKLPAKGLLYFVALLVLLAGALLGVLSLPWAKTHGDVPPRGDVIARGGGPLAAPIAGFAHLAYRSDGADPVTSRALILSSGGCRVAVVSAEILLVPDSLRAAVMARISGLGLAGVVLGATHTHASPGGYWENFAAERAGLGPYDPAMRDIVANAMAESVRRAVASLGPARLSVARGRNTNLVNGRGGAPPDGRLTVLRFDRPDGQPLAELTVFASHPTVLGIRNRRISGDWPSQFFARSEQGVRLLLQGPVGDQTNALPAEWGPLTVQTYGDAVDRAVDALAFDAPDPEPPLAYAGAEVTLPTPEPPIVPRPFRQAAANVVAGILPSQGRVSALRIGPVLLLDTPVEVGGPDSEVVSLADGYLGYLDGPGPQGLGGHPERSYYGPALEPALERGLSLVVGAVKEAARPPQMSSD
jgi:neutral ceramidase